MLNRRLVQYLNKNCLSSWSNMAEKEYPSPKSLEILPSKVIPDGEVGTEFSKVWDQ